MNSLATEECYLCIPLPAPASALKGDGDSCSHFIVPEWSHPLRPLWEYITEGAQAHEWFLGVTCWGQEFDFNDSCMSLPIHDFR